MQRKSSLVSVSCTSWGCSEQLCLEELQHLVNDLYCSTVQFGTELRTVCGRGENEYVVPPPAGITMSHCSCSDGRRARELVVRGCKPNAVDGRGWNAVHHAAEYGQASTIEMLVELLEEELELDKQDNRGWYAAHQTPPPRHTAQTDTQTVPRIPYPANAPYITA